jgi:hypothetical protein
VTVLEAVSYVADVWILTTYFLLAHSGRARPYHLANFVSAFPLAAFEVAVGAWPVLILTVAYGVLAGVGLWRTR